MQLGQSFSRVLRFQLLLASTPSSIHTRPSTCKKFVIWGIACFSWIENNDKKKARERKEEKVLSKNGSGFRWLKKPQSLMSTKDQFKSNAHINAQIESRLATNNKKETKKIRGKWRKDKNLTLVATSKTIWEKRERDWKFI